MDNPETDIENIIAGGSRTLKILGTILILLGLAAIVFPHMASISVELFAGWLFVIGGVVQVFHTLQSKGHGGFMWAILVGLLQIAVGLILLVYPLSGVIALTVFLAVSFLVEGIFRTGQAMQIRPRPGWFWALLSGMLSIVVGVLLYVQLPGSALWAIGLLIGINLAMGGWALLMLAMAGSAISEALEA